MKHTVIPLFWQRTLASTRCGQHSVTPSPVPAPLFPAVDWAPWALAAIGAATGTGTKTVLITGDGSFGMNLNELATAVSNQTPVVIFIMNNGVLGMVRQWQTLFFQKHYSNTTLNRKTDFVKLAEAFGLPGLRAASLPELKEVLQQAAAIDGPVLIDCAIDCDAFVLPMLPPGGCIDDIIVDPASL